MMVSSAMAVLPVWRSPMISSRWPRPIGIMPSMALMPVCMRLLHGLAVDDAGRDALDRVGLVGDDGAFAVDGTPERVHHAADQRLAHRHRHDRAGAAHFLAFLDVLVFAQQHRAHLIFFEVHGDAGNAVAELDQLARHDLVEAVNARDAVADRHDGADFADIDGTLVVLDLVPQNACNLVCPYLSHKIPSHMPS